MRSKNVSYFDWELMFKKKLFKDAIERTCCSCQSALSYDYFSHLNKNLFPEDELRKIWNDKRIELHCTDCLMDDLKRGKNVEILMWFQEDDNRRHNEFRAFLENWKKNNLI